MKKLSLLVVAVFLAEIADLLEERHDGAAAVQAELAADEIERLDAVGAFIDHGDAGIAHILAHAVLFDIAVTAEDLLGHDGVVEALVGHHALEDRGDEAENIVGGLALLLVGRAMGDIGLERGPEQEGAAGLVEGADGHQRAADIGMHDDRIGLLVRRLRAGQRTALDALAGIIDGVLIGDFGDRQALQRRRSRRASFIITNMALRPRFSAPIRKPVASS